MKKSNKQTHLLLYLTLYFSSPFSFLLYLTPPSLTRVYTQRQKLSLSQTIPEEKSRFLPSLLFSFLIVTLHYLLSFGGVTSWLFILTGKSATILQSHSIFYSVKPPSFVEPYLRGAWEKPCHQKKLNLFTSRRSEYGPNHPNSTDSSTPYI